MNQGLVRIIVWVTVAGLVLATGATLISIVAG